MSASETPAARPISRTPCTPPVEISMKALIMPITVPSSPTIGAIAPMSER